MIPDSLATIVAFLLLLAPGVLWQLMQARHAPAIKETALVEASRVVLASLLATGAAGLLLLWWPWLPLYRRASADGDGAFATLTDVAPYLGAVVATSLLACTLTWVAARLRWRTPVRIRPGRVWSRIFVDMVPPGSGQPALLVELLDGTVWRGTLEAFDSDPEDDQRNLALSSPLARKRPGDEKFEPKGDRGRYVIVPEPQIKSIQVTYVRAVADSAGGRTASIEQDPHGTFVT
ncbi:DUF6338 family protein [Cellulosimicrobium funkei]|uniref:DUF6338 family protein n=1 Tax=Cellulosimicrobium funkei TaxID=264251 RepID=UPI00365D86FA